MTERDEQVSAADAARAERLADWAESDEWQIADTAQPVPDEEAEALLNAAFGSDELARLRGRPGLQGHAGDGRSPKLQVRVPRELAESLRERAAAEHRKPSEIMREALAAYLKAS